MSESRLWGEWRSEFYQSGTTMVCQSTTPHKPHLYVYGDAAINDDRYQTERMTMCEQLATYLNGGDRPQWLDDLERRSERIAVALSGAEILATGPFVDANPPGLDWQTDMSPEAQDDRARLMDVLFLPAATAE